MRQIPSGPSQRPKILTLFIAAFLAGGTAAVGVNRFLDVAREQSKPTIECEPIFVAMRSLAAGTSLTVWDVALKDWPKAAVPQAAMRPDDSFEGHSVKLPVNEGQPVLRTHLQAVNAANASPVGPSGELPAEAVAVIESLAAESASPSSSSFGASSEPQEAVAAIGEPVVVESAFVPPHDERTEPATTPTLASTQDPAPQPAKGDGWPTPAESAGTGTDTSAMRFLVVPERIAILADQLVAPIDNTAAQTVGGAVPTEPMQSMKKMQPQPEQEQPRPNVATRPKAAPPRMSAPRGTSAGVAPVKVEPDPEAQIPVEIPAFKTVFPTMAAGIERIESEMGRFRRERFGSLRKTEPDAE